MHVFHISGIAKMAQHCDPRTCSTSITITSLEHFTVRASSPCFPQRPYIESLLQRAKQTSRSSQAMSLYLWQGSQRQTTCDTRRNLNTSSLSSGLACWAEKLILPNKKADSRAAAIALVNNKATADIASHWELPFWPVSTPFDLKPLLNSRHWVLLRYSGNPELPILKRIHTAHSICILLAISCWVYIGYMWHGSSLNEDLGQVSMTWNWSLLSV